MRNLTAPASANNNSAGPSVMTVPSNAAGVQVTGCSTWHKIG